MIVRRNRPSVGTRRIVRRSQRGVMPPGGPPSGDGRRFRPRLPRIPRRWVWGTIAGLSVLAMITTTAWLYQSPIFEISHVNVEGNERISTVAIVDRANLFGESMFTADLAAAQGRLYGLPLVNSVRVERQWPNTIRIIIEERQAWGTWEQAGTTYTIDRDGYVLGTIPPEAGAPAIRSEAGGPLHQGDRVDYQAVEAAAEIYDRLPRQLGTQVREVAYLQGKGVQVTTVNGQTALFGDSSSIAYKLSVWAAIEFAARAEGLEYTFVDLRYGNRPVVQ